MRRGYLVAAAEVAIEAEGWVFWRWTIMLAGACIEVEESVEAGKVGVGWWFIVVTRFRSGATEDRIGQELEG